MSVRGKIIFMKIEHGNIKAERPEELGNLRVSDIHDTAAGMRAVLDSMKETITDAGFVRSKGSLSMRA